MQSIQTAETVLTDIKTEIENKKGLPRDMYTIGSTFDNFVFYFPIIEMHLLKPLVASVQLI